MNGRGQVDTLLFEGSAIDADIQPGKRQVPILDSKPSITKGIEVLGTTRPEFIDDFAGVIANGLAVLSKNSDLLGTEPIFVQRPQCRHQVYMRVAGCIVIDPVCDHTLRRDMLGNEVLHQRDVLLGGELDRQRDGDVLGELGIHSFLEHLDLVPERFRGSRDRAIGDHGAQPVWRIGRDHELLVQKPLLACVVDCACFPLIVHPGAVPVGRRQHCAAARATGDDAD